MTLDIYDRQGNPITLEEWGKLREDIKNVRVAEDTINGKWISTVWLGINHHWGDGVPLIFETMVFPSEGLLNEEYMDRYSTEAEALEGHKRIVEMVKLLDEVK